MWLKQKPIQCAEINQEYDKNASVMPFTIAKKAVLGFLFMLISYISAMFVYVFDVYYGICVDEDNYGYIAIPSLYLVSFIVAGGWILRYFYKQGALTDVA